MKFVSLATMSAYMSDCSWVRLVATCPAANALNGTPTSVTNASSDDIVAFLAFNLNN